MLQPWPKSESFENTVRTRIYTGASGIGSMDWKEDEESGQYPHPDGYTTCLKIL